MNQSQYGQCQLSEPYMIIENYCAMLKDNRRNLNKLVHVTTIDTYNHRSRFDYAKKVF